ncbi:MAG: Folylpolyglutamate synthase [Firmicutes bacterium]|nr:Folylpolyglutamate synthase [candidate division NPL-UPA2 bacterium]
MNYEQAVDYIHSLGRFGSVLGLSRMLAALAELGHPEKKLRVIHVAGTNGKGSTASIIASVLRSAGLRTGLYTSPYLDSFTNRFGLDGNDITPAGLADMVQRILPVAERLRLTQFEFITTLALVFYAEQAVDALVLEVGLGGRFDATNVVIPKLSVITNIGFDHMEVLGNTLGKIAYEKAGIIKPAVPVTTAVEDSEALTVIADVAAEHYSPLRLLGRDYGYLAKDASLAGQTFDYWGIEPLGELSLALLGSHQLKNAALAVDAALMLRAQGWLISLEHIRQGVAAARWPGRFEVMHQNGVRVIMDGAHNTHGVAALIATLRQYLPDQKVLLVSGIMKDKEPEVMLAALAPCAKRLYACAPDLPRATPASELCGMADICALPAEAHSSVADALHAAINAALQSGESVLVAGSLYTVSEARMALSKC